MNVDAIGTVGPAGGAVIGRVPAGVAVGGVGGVAAIVITGVHFVHAILNGGGAITGTAAGPVGIIGDRGAVFGVEHDLGIAGGVFLNNDTHSLNAVGVGCVDVLIRVIVVRAALEHKDDRVAAVKGAGEFGVVVDVGAHHGVDVRTAGGVGDEICAGQRVDTADGFDFNRNLETGQQTGNQTDHQQQCTDPGKDSVLHLYASCEK